MFKVKKLNVSSGGPNIAILNSFDALKFGFHKDERIKIFNDSNEVIAVVDVSDDEKFVPKNTILVNEETFKKLFYNVSYKKFNSKFNIRIVGKPVSLHYIKKKLSGEKLSYKELYSIVKDIVDDKLLDYEISFFVAGGFVSGFSFEETFHLTKAMVNTGDKLFFGRNVFDKHCTGGVPNNRTTMIIVPIVAAAGLKIPKTSSRAITSPAGTADVMEVLANVNLSEDKIKSIVKKHNGVIAWGGSLNLAPADDKIIRVERPLNIDVEGQLIASVLAKKISAGSKKVLIDIPVGKDTKFKIKSDAFRVKKHFENIGKKLGLDIKVIITDGEEPIGRGIGPVLEARDVLWILERNINAPKDLEEKALRMAGLILEMSSKVSKGKGYDLARHYLYSGKALKKMKEIISAQGRKVDVSNALVPGKYSFLVKAYTNGIVNSYNTHLLSVLSQILGSPHDKKAGLYLSKVRGDSVRRGDIIFSVYAENLEKLKLGKNFLDDYLKSIVEIKK